MSVQRQANLLGQQRLDVPHIRAIESSIAADFDVLAGRAMAGGAPLVVRGFTLANISVGTAASAVQLATADSILFNLNATEAGTIFWVPADRAIETLNSTTNVRVDGSFTVSQVNYVGLDLNRTADDSTSDLVQFLDANTLLENPRNVPLGRTLDYRIVISTTPFSSTPNLIPIARITTNSQNQVSAVDDARNLMYRLAEGGDFPNQYGSFSWPVSRTEYDPAIANLSTLDKFSGGDKDIRSQKDWMDAVMSRLWEVGGGQHWYSQTADRNLKLVGAPSPAVFASSSDNFEWGIESGVPATGLYTVNHLHWQGLKILFENSDATGIYYNTVVDQLTDDVGTPATSTGSKTALAVGDCLYVDIDRTTAATLVVHKAALQSLGSPTIPGSRVILAWRTAEGVFRRDSQHPVNTSYPVATTGAPGSVRLAYAAGTPITPTVAPLNSFNQMVLGAGAYLITGNNPALLATGGGTGYGADFTGGSSNGSGVHGLGIGTGWGAQFKGGNSNGNGVRGEGVGIGSGGYFITDAADSTPLVCAVRGFGNGTNHIGVWGSGTGTMPGLYGSGTVLGVWGEVNGTATAVKGSNTAGTGLAAEFVASGAGIDAVKITTGILRVRSIQDSAGGALVIGTDNTKTTTVTIGNSASFTSVVGPLLTSINIQAGAGITVPAANDYAYASARTFQKIVGAWSGNIVTGTGSPTVVFLSTGSRPALGKIISGGGTDNYTVYGQFSLPLGAIITAATIKVTHGGSAASQGSTTIRKGTVAASGTEWTEVDVMAGGSYVIPFAVGAGTGVDFAIPMHATAGNRTVSTTADVFNWTYTGTGTAAQYFISINVTYTLVNLTPAIG